MFAMWRTSCKDYIFMVKWKKKASTVKISSTVATFLQRCIGAQRKRSAQLSPCSLPWPSSQAAQASWSPAPTGTCCGSGARLLPPCTSESRRQTSAGAGLRRSRSGCSWAMPRCAGDCARSDTPRAHRSAPGCRSGPEEAAAEEAGSWPEAGTWARPSSSCSVSSSPRCHVWWRDRTGRPCRSASSGTRSCSRLAAPHTCPSLVRSSRARSNTQCCTSGSCTADSLEGTDERGQGVKHVQKLWKQFSMSDPHVYHTDS